MPSKLLVVISIGVFALGGSAVACVDDSDCSDGNLCTEDICIDGSCSNPPHVNGTPCPDNNFCNGTETCQDGACYPGYPVLVDDANPCTLDYCDQIIGAVNEPHPDGTSCSDGEPANGEETCQAGVCTAGVPPPVPVLSGSGGLLLSLVLVGLMGWVVRRQVAAR